jgi:hypothetical protein
MNRGVVIVNVERREQRAQTRCSIKAAIEIKSIAEQLFKMFETAHRDIGINRPSNKVAVDYLLACAAINGYVEVGKLTPENNLYLKICKEV